MVPKLYSAGQVKIEERYRRIPMKLAHHFFKLAVPYRKRWNHNNKAFSDRITVIEHFTASPNYALPLLVLLCKKSFSHPRGDRSRGGTLGKKKVQFQFNFTVIQASCYRQCLSDKRLRLSASFFQLLRQPRLNQ